jgi:hypothetical protein
MGIGDSRPVIDNSRLGECLLLSILLIAMLTSLIVVALLVSFIHSILPAWDSEIGHLISDSCRCRSIASVADAGNEKPFQ